VCPVELPSSAGALEEFSEQDMWSGMRAWNGQMANSRLIVVVAACWGHEAKAGGSGAWAQPLLGLAMRIAIAGWWVVVLVPCSVMAAG
jgi:hypothetical protein